MTDPSRGRGGGKEARQSAWLTQRRPRRRKGVEALGGRGGGKESRQSAWLTQRIPRRRKGVEAECVADPNGGRGGGQKTRQAGHRNGTAALRDGRAARRRHRGCPGSVQHHGRGERAHRLGPGDYSTTGEMNAAITDAAITAALVPVAGVDGEPADVGAADGHERAAEWRRRAKPRKATQQPGKM